MLNEKLAKYDVQILGQDATTKLELEQIKQQNAQNLDFIA